MSLSAEEKAAGRKFRTAQQLHLIHVNAGAPPTFVVPPLLAVFRHSCPSRGGISTALELREMYVLSPEDPDHDVAAGRFAFLYKEGRCRHCGATARSGQGRVVDAYDRPALSWLNR